MNGHQHWMRPDIQTPLSAPGETYELDAITKLLGHRNVQIGNACYAFAMHCFAVDELPECKRREDRDLVGYVERFDIVGRIGLGEPESLCIGKRILEAPTSRLHRCEYVVGSAVEYAGYAADFICLQASLQC